MWLKHTIHSWGGNLLFLWCYWTPKFVFMYGKQICIQTTKKGKILNKFPKQVFLPSFYLWNAWGRATYFWTIYWSWATSEGSVGSLQKGSKVKCSNCKTIRLKKRSLDPLQVLGGLNPIIKLRLLPVGFWGTPGLCRKNEAGFRLVPSQDRGGILAGGQRGIGWSGNGGSCIGNRIEGQTFHLLILQLNFRFNLSCMISCHCFVCHGGLVQLSTKSKWKTHSEWVRALLWKQKNVWDCGMVTHTVV